MKRTRLTVFGTEADRPIDEVRNDAPNERAGRRSAQGSKLVSQKPVTTNVNCPDTAARVGHQDTGVFELEGVETTPATTKVKQFNFARHWRRKIAPLLSDRDVVMAMTLGLKLYDINYGESDPPWLLGRGPLNGQRAREGCLSWYQPWGRCHYIAPFCWALGKKLFPDHEWGFITGDIHNGRDRLA